MLYFRERNTSLIIFHMKRFLFSLLLLTATLPFTTLAQNCIPDNTIVNSGFYPATLDTVNPGDNHSQILQIRVLKDTTIVLFGFPQKAFIDSVVLKGIIGLPPGFNYKCYNERCRYVPDSTGCAVLFGTAKTSDAGVYPLKLAVDIYGRLAGGFAASQPDTIRTLTLVVRGGTASIERINTDKADLYPNPSKDGKIHLQVNPNWLPATFECYSADGRLVLQQTVKETSTLLDLSNMEHAIYFGNLKGDSGRVLWRGKLSTVQD
jgi:hypothetical protein